MAFLYETVAADIESAIKNGEFLPGERAPSVREVTKGFKVSLQTALQALTLLERRGLVEARPQSGFYVTAQNTAALPASDQEADGRAGKASIVETGPLINEVVAAARDYHLSPLGAASLASDLLPGVAIAKSVSWAMRTHGADILAYAMPPGNEDLRRQVARRALSYGVRARAENVVVTTGSMEAISLALRVTARPGAAVAIESPMFYGIVELLRALDLKAVEIPAHPETGMDIAVLERAVKSRKIAAVLAIPNFNNPLGSRMPDAAKQQLVEILAREEIPLIEDDIYGDLQHDGERPIVAKAFDKKGLVLLCSSFSKTISPGLRVGWIMAGRFQADIERMQFATTIAPATLPQAAVAHFLEQGGYDRFLRQLRGKLRTRLCQYQHAIQKHFPEGTRVSRPEGGFVLWVQMPPGVDATEVYRAARARGVSVIPGPAFSSGLDRFRDCLRISCGSALTGVMDNALAILGEEARGGDAFTGRSRRSFRSSQDK